MHIPDGYLSPTTIVVSYAVTLPLWIYGFKKLKEKLNENTLPLIGSLTALSFIIMMLNVPIPGGTSGHALGTALISILFGPWIAFISISLVLLIQAVIFGDGGISALAIESFAMGFVASFVAYYVFKLLKNKKFAPFIAGYLSIVVASFIIALALGIQPIFWRNNNPLYFPFDLKVTIPAIVGSHIVAFGLVEGILTQLLYNFLTKKEENE